MDDKITLYRLRGEMPEEKICREDYICVCNHNDSGSIECDMCRRLRESKIHNQAIDDITAKLEKVEITEAEIKGQIRCIDFSRFENATMSKGKLCEIIAQAIFELLKGGE